MADIFRGVGVDRSTATRVCHDTNNRIDFETLELLCNYLDCTVGELLEVYSEQDKNNL
ncbi:helix-turn-helix transcriptional regulator [Psychromonas sp. 14N.309.X.WAT.B.A12]|uniref:helix-turn-helix domain-containing protein n=1 Tax=unclassified Psychromonas TaxID=2614957 RepID=UPI00339D578F